MSGTAAAARLGVDRTTIYRWARVGILHPARTAGGHRRYAVEEIEALARRLEAGEDIERPPPTS